MGAAIDQMPGLSLYALTFVVELASVAARFMAARVVLFCAAGAGFSAANSIGASYAALALALWPAVGSLAALLALPGTALEHRDSAARRPSARERQQISAAISGLGAHEAPRRILVVDDPRPAAQSLGLSLYVNRGLLEDPAMAAVLAHELGHLDSLDARLALALRRLRPRLGQTRIPLGGTGIALTRPLWRAWLRGRELRADRFAARLGRGAELADFLERQLVIETPAENRRRTHPPTELRIERLRSQACGRNSKRRQ